MIGGEDDVVARVKSKDEGRLRDAFVLRKHNYYGLLIGCCFSFAQTNYVVDSAIPELTTISRVYSTSRSLCKEQRDLFLLLTYRSGGCSGPERV